MKVGYNKYNNNRNFTPEESAKYSKNVVSKIKPKHRLKKNEDKNLYKKMSYGDLQHDRLPKLIRFLEETDNEIPIQKKLIMFCSKERGNKYFLNLFFKKHPDFLLGFKDDVDVSQLGD